MPAPSARSNAESELPRAALPVQQLNPYIKNLDPTKLPAVKFQEIVRDGQSTVVARVKIPTPSGHAFILRRLDTGAISMTTMFRAAFPTASDDQERAESAWVKQRYDNTGANRSGRARFAGIWVAPNVAKELAHSYALSPIIDPLADAAPAPNVAYRRSSRATQGGTPTSSPSTAVATPREGRDVPPPSKRRRDASPAPSAPPTPVQATPSRTRIPVATSTPATRRSARLRSPAPPTVPALTPATPRSPKATRSRAPAAVEQPTPVSVVEDDVTEVSVLAAPNMEEDLAEQRALVEKLKAERVPREILSAPTEIIVEETLKMEVRESHSGIKRVREEDSVELKLNIKEPESEDRAIASNSRVRRILDMPPERKSFAWGALFFAAGMSAITFLPTLPSFLS